MCMFIIFLSSINHHLWSEKFLAVPWGSMHRQPPGEIGKIWQNASKCSEKCNFGPEHFAYLLPPGWNTKVQEEARGYKGLKSWMPTPVIIWEVHKTVLWRPRSSQFLLQDASWMSMCFGCDHEKVWTESLSIVGTQQSSSMFANQPTQESWCEGDRSDQRLHLNAIFSCLVETTTFRVAHTLKDVWSLLFKQSKQCAFGPIKCTLRGFLIPASALMALSYIDEARGQAGVSQKICSWDSISNWSRWEPSVAFAGRCGNQRNVGI